MSIGQTFDGKPVQVGDNATAVGVVASISGTFVTITLASSGASVTVDSRDINGPGYNAQESNPLKTPAVHVADAVNFSGVVVGVQGAGSTATLTLAMRYPFTLSLSAGAPQFNVNVQAQDVVASQSL